MNTCLSQSTECFGTAARRLRAVLAAASFAAVLAAGTLAARAGEAPAVSVSILPIHSLVAGVMAGTAAPGLLVQPGVSPHGFALRPSQMATIGNAALIVRVGKGLDGFLDRAIAARTTDDLGVLTLMTLPGIILRRWDLADSHDHEPDDGVLDPHIWLDPANARLIVAAVAGELTRLDPANDALYGANAAALDARLAALDDELWARLAPLAEHPFVVFHDAYGYLQDRYGLKGALAVTLDPERKPGARRISELREAIEKLGVGCVFAEPQYSAALVETLIEGTGARLLRLDPLGAGVAPGPEAYFALMRTMAEAMTSCMAD
jgi:zinc transport system substrate-binding protein